MDIAYIERDLGDPKRQRVFVRFVWVGLPSSDKRKVPAIPGKKYTFSQSSSYFFDSIPEAKDWCARMGFRAEVVLWWKN